MAQIEKLIVELDAKVDAYVQGMDKAGKQNKKTETTTQRLASSIARVASVASIAAAAISAMAITASQYAKEIQIAAQRTGETVEEMQLWAFAADTVGISLEKLGDIGKDTNEKIGDFLATGGGGFQDFADVMGLTSAQARALALEFETMSGTDVLQEMVKRMEEAGISTGRMSFALEGMASDTTDLIPLLTDGADELNRLKNEAGALGTVLDQDQLDNIRRVGIEFSKLQSSFSAGSRQLISDYSEEIITAIQWTQTLGTKSVELFNVITAVWSRNVEVIKAGISDLTDGTDTLSDTILEQTEKVQDAFLILVGEKQKAFELVITGGTAVQKKTTAEEKGTLNQRATNFKNYVGIASKINEGFLEENKAIKAGLIVADTAAAVMLQLSSGDPFTAFSRAALAAAIGAVQLSNALSATKGGGAVSGGSGGATTDVPVTQAPEPSTNVALRSQLISEDGSTSTDARFINVTGGDTGDQLMAEWYNDSVASGRLEP